MAAPGRIVHGGLDLIGAVVGAHRQHVHLIAVGIGQPSAIGRPRRHMAGKGALALRLRGQAFGHRHGLGAIFVDRPQFERALLVHVKAQSCAVGTE